MATNSARLLLLGVVLGSCSSLAGCAGSGPIASRQGMVGSLKTSVAQLEGDNQTLRREMAQLKAENTRVEDFLAQEKAANGELAARLDDAKELIARQGGNTNALGRGSKTSLEDDIPPPVKTINRSSRRPPPSAEIPRPRLRAQDPDDDVLDPGPSPARRGRDRDLGPQGRLDGDDENRWLPVARGGASTSARLR